MAQTGDDDVLTVRVPFRVLRRGARTLIAMVETGAAAQGRAADPALIAALAKAWSWQRRLDAGDVSSIDDLAADEGLDVGYASRVVGLCALAPRLVQSLLDGALPRTVSVKALFQLQDLNWPDQLARTARGCSPASLG